MGETIHGQEISDGYRRTEAAKTKAQTRQGKIDQVSYLIRLAKLAPSGFDQEIQVLLVVLSAEGRYASAQEFPAVSQRGER